MSAFLTSSTRRRGFALAAAMASVVAAATSSRAQVSPDPNYVRQPIFASYEDFKNRLANISEIADAAERTARLDAFWAQLKSAGQIPYAQGNRMAFLYRGTTASLAVAGDFNGWDPSGAGWQAMRLPGTDLWMLEKTFAADARLDYKLVAAGGAWMLDPDNPLQMWSGFGPNSELRMPAYVAPQEPVRRAGGAQGTLSANIATASARLGYDVNYRVYTPAEYATQKLADLPTVYVTDGHEYSADATGSMVVVLDNLIASGALRPTIAVFIDPRDPKNPSNNRRATEYTQNAGFLGFVADELVPAIDAAYRTLDAPDGRTILGTSLGGVNAAYFGAARPDVFGNVAVQSPADFSRFAPQTLNLYATQPLQKKLDVYVTAGTIGDGDAGPRFASVLQSHGYDYTFREVNEGHSWGNWRALIGDMLVKLIGPR